MAMNDIETALREAMDAAVAGARPPHDVMELVRGQHRRRKARLALASTAAAAAVVIAAAAVVGVVGSTAGRPSSEVSSKPSPTSPRDTASAKNLPLLPRGWTRHADAFGDSIDTPAGWHVQDLSRALFDPVALWVIGTGPVPADWNCAPTSALRKLPADGVLVAITEGSGGGAYPQRPRRLGLGPLGGPFECWGIKTHSLLFADGGRYFNVQTVFGASAPPILRTDLERSLNTLRITPLAESSKSALCAGWPLRPGCVR
jgi:hypothetical protein